MNMRAVPPGVNRVKPSHSEVEEVAMKKALVALLVVSVTCLLVAPPASAQDMQFGLDEAGDAKAPKKKKKKKGKASRGAETAPAEETAEPAATDTATDASAAGAEGAQAAPAEGDVIGQLAAPTDKGATGPRSTAPQAKEVAEEVYAVQQIYALRNGRFELAPSIAFTVNDPFVSHPAPSIAFNYWWTNVLAIGANFLWYQGLENESDLNFFVRRSTRLAVPITEYQLGAHLNFTYVPLYGKFAMFNDHIFQWDAYVVGGLGVMRTRPVAVIDPEIRQFEFDWRVAFNAGIGLRVFITRYLAIFGEIRDYAYLEQFENLSVALGSERSNPDTWLADKPTLTNNVTVHLGATLFFPFDFDYKRPK
jgi:outer membrane beta-barrel protein